MNERQIDAIKSLLGDDIFETLEKTEIVKINTQTGVDPEEIKVALQIVPRSILSYLFLHLKHRPDEDVIELDLPFADDARMHINKKGADNYSGTIYQKETKVLEFQNRSLPSMGLLILTTFELYDMSLLDEVKHKQEESEKTNKLQDIIDERLSLYRTIQDVVDKRISEREAINRMLKERLQEHVMMANDTKREEPMEESKKSKLKQFLEERESKRQEPVELDKSEIKCPDCATTIYKGEKEIKLCLCYGEHMNKNIKIKKGTDGRVKLQFPKSFDIDNVEMLLDALKNK